MEICQVGVVKNYEFKVRKMRGRAKLEMDEAAEGINDREIQGEHWKGMLALMVKDTVPSLGAPAIKLWNEEFSLGQLLQW